MKIGIKYTVMATLMSLATLNTFADQTNLVRSLNIDLSGFQQGDSSTSKNVTTTSVNKVSYGTTDVINAIGAAKGHSFSANAQLVVITPLPSGSTHIAIRDGAYSDDVSEFFVQSYLTEVIGKSTSNSKTGKSTGSNYSLQEFSLVDPGGYNPLSFQYSVTGVATENFTIPAIPGPRSELKADVTGTGDSNGELLLLQGSIKVTGQTIEVVSGGGNPPPA